MFNAFTNEIDDTEIAVEEITTQLKDKKLGKNTIGIIACYFEFVENGTITALCNALPFDVIGCAVQGSAVNEGGGMEQLSLTVLTSDKITFTSAISEPLHPENFDNAVENVYNEVANSAPNPSLIFLLGPITTDISGHSILKKLDQLSNGLPIFGTLSNDTSLKYESSYVFKNNEQHLRKMILLFVNGDIKPRFYTTAITARNILRQSAVVTESSDYLVKKINDMPVTEYFKSIGVQTSKLAAVSMLPLLVDFDDGTVPAAYSMYDISENGAYCGGAIPVGAFIAFAEIDYNSVIETAETTLKSALDDIEKNGANGMIAIPCLTRSLVLIPNIDDEIKKTLEIVGNRIPFILIYSGGEICPTYNKQHEIVNRFHNLTYTIMVF
ncbi:MAG: FIST C-terminal domain-containing protein [Planctomycetaceae bacterium]|jgi:hypothetical protein|nr:FIST C-terminal domain-containing protein [Planctomycetaceae bacterium]